MHNPSIFSIFSHFSAICELNVAFICQNVYPNFCLFACDEWINEWINTWIDKWKKWINKCITTEASD